ncbi:fasciclin-1 isoform X2 [Leptopilina heterotoma]|uniref:fasciclin-1 isoform X2 n=1 Tax=Leptopilina heterotoma TaxID=63436 RepID=UPI001CAA0826|nr:fasciclin-1 isoform X2 [Leptopilina heterotoma]
MSLKVLTMCLPAFLFLIVIAGGHASSEGIKKKIEDDPDLSQFLQLLESNKVALATLNLRPVTVFASTNRAFQTYKGSADQSVIPYHITTFPYKINQLEHALSLNSELDGNPPLWVTRRRNGKTEDVYINNAKILTDRSNIELMIGDVGDTKKQVLHQISEVLEPVVSIRSADTPIVNPNALQFLNNTAQLNLGSRRTRTFQQRVTTTGKEEVFKADGKFTFFIPEDEGFKPSPRPEKIDGRVIDGHVIPHHVLFTGPTPNDKPYRTLANDDNLNVTISFYTEQDGKSKRVYVKSNTIVGDKDHPTGVVLAEIIKANIPVKNGVVHLIQRPLIVVDTTIKEFLESFKEKEDGPVYKFYNTIIRNGDNFMNSMKGQPNITLFAPSNAAWDVPEVKGVLTDSKRIEDILNLHLVREPLPLDLIKQKSGRLVQSTRKGNHGVPTAADKKNLYFNVAQSPFGNETVTVEGGGVNATIITANIAATNGMIHIIDRVLGIPYTTVLDKLKSDPQLNLTYLLGTKKDFNSQLSDTNKRFTFFAPKDSAWKATQITYPSTYKKLFMDDFSYHATQILQRHLVISDQHYTMSQLLNMSRNGTVTLSTARDVLHLRIRESRSDGKRDENAIVPNPSGPSGYILEWQGLSIKVDRPDVSCTNGIIHVIDGAFLKDSDVRVTGGSAAFVATCLPHILVLLVVKWLL